MLPVTAAELKVFSAIFSNLVVLWVAAIPGSIGNQRVLTVDIFLAKICA